MTTFEVIILLIVIVLVVMVYNKYSPAIDIVKSGKRYSILLWYTRRHYEEECKRVYIKLFEV